MYIRSCNESKTDYCTGCHWNDDTEQLHHSVSIKPNDVIVYEKIRNEYKKIINNKARRKNEIAWTDFWKLKKYDIIYYIISRYPYAYYITTS